MTIISPRIKMESVRLLEVNEIMQLYPWIKVQRPSLLDALQLRFTLFFASSQLVVAKPEPKYETGRWSLHFFLFRYKYGLEPALLSQEIVHHITTALPKAAHVPPFAKWLVRWKVRVETNTTNQEPPLLEFLSMKLNTQFYVRIQITKITGSNFKLLMLKQ